jgi:hypothetical protein
MSCPATQNFCIPQGGTWSQPLVWKTGDPPAAVNLTGYTARMQARAKVADATPVISLTTETAGGITLGGSAGTITLALTAAQTTAITAGRYVYDLELVTGTTVRRLLEGIITVSAEVTR